MRAELHSIAYLSSEAILDLGACEVQRQGQQSLTAMRVDVNTSEAHVQELRARTGTLGGEGRCADAEGAPGEGLGLHTLKYGGTGVSDGSGRLWGFVDMLRKRHEAQHEAPAVLQMMREAMASICRYSSKPGGLAPLGVGHAVLLLACGGSLMDLP